MTRRTYQLDGEPQTPNAPVGQPDPPLNPDLAGYPSVEALTQGYRASGLEAQRLKAENDQLRQLVTQRPEIQARGHMRAEDRLSELGIPTDALDEYVNQRLQRSFEPLVRGMTARSTVMAEYPDYHKFENDVAQFISSDTKRQQAYNNMFQADPEGAMDWAFLKFGETRRRSQPAAEPNGSEKAHAQIPNGRGGESRQKADPNTDDRAQKAFKAYQETGDPRAKEAFVKARLGNIFSEGFFEK